MRLNCQISGTLFTAKIIGMLKFYNNDTLRASVLFWTGLTRVPSRRAPLPVSCIARHPCLAAWSCPCLAPPAVAAIHLPVDRG